MSNKTPRVNAYTASDYAGLSVGGVAFYYGYEFDLRGEADEGWAEEHDSRGFEARIGEVSVCRIPYDDLAKNPDCPRGGWECANMLLFGIGVALATGKIVVNAGEK